jgi:hypothetical protein
VRRLWQVDVTDTFIDGGGAVADEPLPEGTWIRFVLDPSNRERDLRVRVLDGQVMIHGMWRPVVVRQTSPILARATTAELSDPPGTIRSTDPKETS